MRLLETVVATNGNAPPMVRGGSSLRQKLQPGESEYSRPPSTITGERKVADFKPAVRS